MAHLGRNLLPTWPILRPSWDHLRPNFAKNLRQIAPEISRSAPRDPKTTQGVARELQDTPGTKMFMASGVDFGLHFPIVPAVSPSIFMTSRCCQNHPNSKPSEVFFIELHMKRHTHRAGGAPKPKTSSMSKWQKRSLVRALHAPSSRHVAAWRAQRIG